MSPYHSKIKALTRPKPISQQVAAEIDVGGIGPPRGLEPALSRITLAPNSIEKSARWVPSKPMLVTIQAHRLMPVAPPALVGLA